MPLSDCEITEKLSNIQLFGICSGPALAANAFQVFDIYIYQRWCLFWLKSQRLKVRIHGVSRQLCFPSWHCGPRCGQQALLTITSQDSSPTMLRKQHSAQGQHHWRGGRQASSFWHFMPTKPLLSRWIILSPMSQAAGSASERDKVAWYPCSWHKSSFSKPQISPNLNLGLTV